MYLSVYVLPFEVLSSFLRLFPFIVHCSPNARTTYNNVSICIVLYCPLKSWLGSWDNSPIVVHCSTDSRTIYYNVSFCIVLSIPETTFLFNIIINGAKRQENFQLYFLRGKTRIWWWGQALFFTQNTWLYLCS